MSAVLQALYEGRQTDAEAIAGAGELDVFEAAALGRAGRVAELIAGDAAAARRWTDDGFTPLHYACFFGTPAATAVLLRAGAEVDVASRNDMGVRPVHQIAPDECSCTHLRSCRARPHRGDAFPHNTAVVHDTPAPPRTCDRYVALTDGTLPPPHCRP